MANHIDLLTKLLATENITILRKPVKTASFDVKDRILTLPIWKDMQDEEELLLVLHEIGHALFTGTDLTNRAAKIASKKRGFFSYVNVVEDVRIENLVKNRYPGSRKDFYTGYKMLAERDLFKLGEINRDKMKLVDKINVISKIGMFLDYSDSIQRLNTKEQKLLDVTTSNVDESKVISIAYAIWRHDQQKNEESKQEQNPDEISISDEKSEEVEEQTEQNSETTAEVSDNEEDKTTDAAEDETPQQEDDVVSTVEDSTIEDPSDEELDQEESGEESETQKNADQTLEKSTVVNISGFRNMNIPKHIPDIVHSYKKIMEYYSATDISEDSKIIFTMDLYSSWELSNKALVSHMCKEFEMRKAADRLKHTKTSKTGRIKTSALYSYKFNDDIFDKKEIHPEDVNHGIIIYLDWSGSMVNNYVHTMKQVITLVSFMRRCNIKFQVFAFSDLNANNTKTSADNDLYQNSIGYRVPFTLLELFSDEMTGNEFKRMKLILMCTKIAANSIYKMNYTPLNAAQAHAIQYAEEFRQKKSVQKVAVTFVTDGGDTFSKRNVGKFGNIIYGNASVMYNTESKRGQASYITMELNQLFKKVHPNIPLLNFYMTSPSVSTMRKQLLREMFPKDALDYDAVIAFCKKIAVQYGKQGYFEYQEKLGYDKLFTLPGTNERDEETILSGDMSSNRIAKLLSKSAKSEKNHRAFVTELIKLFS